MPINWTDLLSSPQKQPGNPGNARLAQMLMEQGVDTSPIQSPFQGLARLAQAWVGRGMMQDDLAKQQQGNQTLADILAPRDGTVTEGAPQSVPLPNVPGADLKLQTPQITAGQPEKNAQIAQL